MERIIESRRLFRFIVLGLLLVALLGPWVFDIIHVPREFSCDFPWARVGGDFCGWPRPGILSVLGNIGWAFLLPVISSIALVWRGESRAWLIFHLLALILAGGILLATGLLRFPRLSWAAWGVLLYVATAAGALLLEAILQLARRSSSRLAN
jgi:hypothetical protein